MNQNVISVCRRPFADSLAHRCLSLRSKAKVHAKNLGKGSIFAFLLVSSYLDQYLTKKSLNESKCNFCL